MKSEKSATVSTKANAAIVGLVLLSAAGAIASVEGHEGKSLAKAEHPAITVQSKFYCNTKALTSAERTRHKELTDKLMSVRKETVETEKGYEFQFSPAEVSLNELAEWVAAEGKCCPFFDFHIDLEREGALLCLRLTGAEGIKAFIRSEF